VRRRGPTRGNLSWASAGLDTGRPGYTLGSTPQPHNEGDFTALGRVIRGMDVVDRSNRREVLGDLNPALRVPTLVLDDGRPLGESGAIIWYLGEGTRFVPEDPYARAQVLQWMFFEQYDHEPAIAVARFWLAYSGRPDDFAEHFVTHDPRIADRNRAAVDLEIGTADPAVGHADLHLADVLPRPGHIIEDQIPGCAQDHRSHRVRVLTRSAARLGD